MSNENYQLEAAEDAAVKKSNTAKRVAVGAGLLAAGAATAYGAEQVVNAANGHAANASEPVIDTDGLTSGAAAGAVEGGVAEQPQAAAEPQVVHENTYVTNYVVQPKEETVEEEPEVEIEKTTYYYDEEGNRIGAIETGSYDDKTLLIVDENGDNVADEMWYDANGNGRVDNGEIHDISHLNHVMGYGDIDVKVVGADDDQPLNHGDEDLVGIHNDWDDEKTGEVYRNDLAQNNGDYKNNGDTSQYAAEADGHASAQVIDEKEGGEDLAYEPEGEQVHNGLVDEPVGEDYSHDFATTEEDYTQVDDIPNDNDYAYEEPVEDDATDVDDVSQYDVV